MIDSGRLDELTAAQRGRCYGPDMAWGEWDQAADFFKIRSASISYRLPEGWLPSGVRGATVSLQGKNLLTLTDFDGLDPESSEDGAALPLYRFEYYNIPPLRSFLLNVKLDF